MIEAGECELAGYNSNFEFPRDAVARIWTAMELVRRGVLVNLAADSQSRHLR